MRRIETINDLEALYGAPVPAALSKVADHLTPLYRKWVGSARFCVVSTVGEHCAHATPRGDIEPVVRVPNPQTVLLPDWQGNNRLDALRDIVKDPRVGLLFMVPGNKTTVRVNGKAWITDDAELRQSFERKGRHPATIVVIEVAEVYTQCAKALMRSELWKAEGAVAGLPTVGEILSDMTDGEVGGGDYDATYEERALPRMW